MQYIVQKWQEIMIHYLYYFIPLPAESEILLTFKRRKHEELIDYGIFLSLTLQLSAETGGSNAVIVEKLQQVWRKRRLFIGRKWQMVCRKPLSSIFGVQTSKGMRIGFILIMVVIFPI